MFTKNDLYNKLIFSVFIVIIYVLLQIFIKVGTEMKSNKSKIKSKIKFVIGKWQLLLIRGIILFIGSYIVLDLYSRSVCSPEELKKVNKEKNKPLLEQDIINDLISIF